MTVTATAKINEWQVPVNMTLAEIERLVIEQTLQRTGGNKTEAAAMLGIYRPRLYSMIQRHGIDTPRHRRVEK
jgi:DNA-binding NtrC family response regulator